jgi:uncharacterized protein
MEFSKHNIFSRVHQSDEYFIVNPLYGSADILTAGEALKFMDHEMDDHEEFITKGYIVDPAKEGKLFRLKYLDFIDSRDADELQLFYVPTYACNFSCSYCYQSEYMSPPAIDVFAAAKAFFQYISEHFSGRRKYITLFGGEPLLSNEQNHRFLEFFSGACRELGVDLAIVTNGYTLSGFIPLLQKATIREIQVTLDGTEAVHNQRRPLKNKTGTFREIVSGIDASLQAGIPINLRVVLDRENIQALPGIAKLAIDKGWTESPLFKTQLGRNYELHFCQSQQAKLYNRLELYQDLYTLILQHPYILQFHKPAYSLSKFLFEQGELPDPLFDSCPGCKTEWAFDYTGRIYSCTATVGKEGEELGTFYPEVLLHKEKVNRWQQRDILSIDACRSCNLKLACGGGCASVALNTHQNLHAPDCRPVKELLEMGISLYSDQNLCSQPNK